MIDPPRKETEEKSMGTKTRREARQARHRRVRKKIRGSSECPRVAVFRSLNNISGQAVDDMKGTTLCSIATTSKQIREQLEGKTSNVEAAEKVGKMLGEKMKAIGIEQAVFDRGGFLYHGRVKAFAEGIREAGVKI